jgi:hypothetical protein
VQCPQCKNDVPLTEAQFGALYSCPKCMAVYFVGFDGQPEYGSMDLPLVETIEDSFMSDLNLNPIEDIPSIDIPVKTFESFSESLPPEFAEVDVNASHDFNAEALSEPIPVRAYESATPALRAEKSRPVSTTFAAAAQEIADYGNQEEVISSISYDVKIQGLDSKEVMLLFKESIEDSKFAWLTQDILGQIKNGEVTLRNLNPIQAFVLASRIQFLDLDIEWKQNVAF